MVLEKTLESLLDSKIKPVNPKGNQPWIFIKNWCWSSNTLAIWCEELTHWKRPWWWERLKTGEEGGDRWLDDWIASSDSMDINLSKLQKTAEGRGAWCAAAHGTVKSQIWLSNWTTTKSHSEHLTSINLFNPLNTVWGKYYHLHFTKKEKRNRHRR